jgi:hypothetical protein
MSVRFVKSAIIAFIGVWVLGACGDTAFSPEFHVEENPKNLINFADSLGRNT